MKAQVHCVALVKRREGQLSKLVFLQQELKASALHFGRDFAPLAQKQLRKTLGHTNY